MEVGNDTLYIVNIQTCCYLADLSLRSWIRLFHDFCDVKSGKSYLYLSSNFFFLCLSFFLSFYYLRRKILILREILYVIRGIGKIITYCNKEIKNLIRFYVLKLEIIYAFSTIKLMIHRCWCKDITIYSRIKNVFKSVKTNQI